jgi:hypothetical protein
MILKRSHFIIVHKSWVRTARLNASWKVRYPIVHGMKRCRPASACRIGLKIGTIIGTSANTASVTSGSARGTVGLLGGFRRFFSADAVKGRRERRTGHLENYQRHSRAQWTEIARPCWNA